MNADQTNRWLTLGANIGVLVGIVLIIVELSQNRDMMRSQVRHQIAIEEANFLFATAYDREMVDRIGLLMNGEQIDVAERMQYGWRAAGWFRLQENIHYQARSGLFDPSEFAGIRNTWKAFVEINPAMESIWCVWRLNYSEEFRVDFDALFDDLQCRNDIE